MKTILHTKDRRKADTIALLALRFADEALPYFPNADLGELRVQLAAAMLKASEMPLLREKFFENNDGSLVSKLFADMEIPDPEWEGFDIV